MGPNLLFFGATALTRVNQVPFVYPAEITTLRLRAKGCAIASAGAWIIEFMVVQITPIAVQNIGYKT
jgi:hypothetical protein